MIKPEEITIIIPHLGATSESEYSLDQCLKSLDETVPNIARILVTNGNVCVNPFHIINPTTTRKGEDRIDIWSQGQCKAVNAATATVNTPWILVTNDDMIYPPGWFEALTDHVVLDDKDLCISPKLVEPRPGAPTFISYFCGGAGGDFNKQEFLDFVKVYKEADKMMLTTGFNTPFLIKKELWDTIGGYDINYDPWGSNSDSDLEYKIKLAGVQPMQNPNALVYHFSQTSGTFEPRNDSYRFKNYAYFKEKWGFDRTDSGIWEASFTIPDEGRIFRPDWEGKYGH